jgi:TFIIF-interacting CTD phosphatase-like protein
MKDLNILLDGRKIKNIVLIDNRAVGFVNLHLTNGIPIMDYEGDPNDVELYHLCDYLMNSLITPAQTNLYSDFHYLGVTGGSHTAQFDVRNVIKKDFKLEKFLTTKAKLREREISRLRQNARTEYRI